MIKTLFLLLASAIAMPLLAQANIGDTVEQSTARYGQPGNRREHFCDFRINGWWIVEWFDPQTGKAEYIMYRKYSGQISQQEADQLLNINVPGYANDQKGYSSRMEYDHFIGEHWAYYLIIESARGHAGQEYDAKVEVSRILGKPTPTP
jgi:hypothetical protein